MANSSPALELLSSITLQLGKFNYFKALFPEVLIDIG